MPETQTSIAHSRPATVPPIVDRTLLTPPLSLHDPEAPPFKPVESDNVSLSMKKRRKRAKHSRRLDRACASSGDVNEEYVAPSSPRLAVSCRSLPDLNHYHPQSGFPVLLRPTDREWIDEKLRKFSLTQWKTSDTPSQVPTQRTGQPQRPRRWTVPIKARSTHLICGDNQPATLTKLAGTATTDTPAMIVLRRATTRMSRAPSIAQSNITFFPPPKLNHESTGLLSYFRRASQQGQGDMRALTTHATISYSHRPDLALSAPRRPSVNSRYAHPCNSTAAEPVLTEVSAFPSIQDGYDGSQLRHGPSPKLRRCSTKIVSGSTVHEIIWDENVGSSGSNSASSNISRRETIKRGIVTVTQDKRRESVAIEKLEKQLQKGKNQLESRRTSSASQLRELPSDPFALDQSHQKSFQSLLNFKFGGAQIKRSDLKNLPRSRASASSAPSQRIEHLSFGRFPSIFDEGEEFPLKDVDDLPVLRGRAPTSTHRASRARIGNDGDGQAHPHTTSPTGQMQRHAISHQPSWKGLGLGQSFRVRHRSVDITHKRLSTSGYRRLEGTRSLARSAAEHMPLLSQTGFDGTSSKRNSTAEQEPSESLRKARRSDEAKGEQSNPSKKCRKTSIDYFREKKSGLCNMLASRTDQTPCHRSLLSRRISQDVRIVALKERLRAFEEAYRSIPCEFANPRMDRAAGYANMNNRKQDAALKNAMVNATPSYGIRTQLGEVGHEGQLESNLERWPLQQGPWLHVAKASETLASNNAIDVAVPL